MIRSVDKWLPGYLASVLRRPRSAVRGRHLIFCVADHFEPFRGGSDRGAALARVDRWVADYSRLFGQFKDADGHPPRHTFFYPQEEYDEEAIDRLLPLVRDGYGEVEVHLHHRQDTAEGLRAKLIRFRDALHARHGCLGVDGIGRPRYGFVHGNWALCNSRPDGDWCGVNDELAVLSETGCYADFTFPSAPSPTQPRMVNAIYRACDTGRPRAADGGDRVRAWRGRRDAGCEWGRRSHRDTESTEGRSARGGEGKELMIIQGPLSLDWRRRKWGVLPRLENGELSGANPPSGRRLALWLRQSIGVLDQPDWVFVKVHTHGCTDANAGAFLGAPMTAFHEGLARLREAEGWVHHYATAREIYNMVRAAEDGCDGNPGEYRDYEVGKPAASR